MEESWNVNWPLPILLQENKLFVIETSLVLMPSSHFFKECLLTLKQPFTVQAEECGRFLSETFTNFSTSNIS